MRTRNSLAQLAKHSGRAQALIDKVAPEYADLTATADAAEQQARDLREAETHRPPWPTQPEEITAEWLDDEVTRRLGISNIETRLQVLADVSSAARDEANLLLADRSDQILEALGADLDELVDSLSKAVGKLGADVNSAAAAIDAGVRSTDIWRLISDAVPVYRDIRLVQLEVYRSTGFERIDRIACGDGIQVIDADARLYNHRNLDAVAPDWRPGLDLRGHQRESVLPWPSDPTERLVWCIRNDSGIWCPTPAQLTALINRVPPRLQGGDREQPRSVIQEPVLRG